MYIDHSMRHFLDKLASAAPEPGGGSAAALAGALASALVSMVANLTLGKEKYKDVEAEIGKLLDEAEKLRKIFQELLQKDTEAYRELSEAYQMPKVSDAEKERRSARIQETLKTAAEVPFQIAMNSVAVAKLAERAAEIGNRNLVSDAGVAALLARACIQAAALNVKINIKSIKDEEFAASMWKQIEKALTEVEALEKKVLQITYEKI